MLDSPNAGSVALLGVALDARSEDIARNMTAAVFEQVDYYKHDNSPSHVSVMNSCRSHLEFVLTGLLAEQSTDASCAQRVGDERARDGLPLHGLMAGHRVASNEVWQALYSAIAGRADLPQDAVLSALERVGRAQHHYAESGAQAHRERSRLNAIDDESEYAALVDALFRGAAVPGRSLWETAELLQIPRSGPYVMVAMGTGDAAGRRSPADITMRLRGLDIYSVWRRLAGSQVGIVCVPSESARANLLDALRRWVNDGAGVSNEFTDLAEVPTALHYAQVAAIRATGIEPVVVVGNGALEIAALVDLDISRRLAATVLGPLNELPAEERQTLHKTFTVWAAHRGSIPETAATLYCHPNTVRYRLQRIESLTGRSVRAPIELSELCLAFEIVAKLPHVP